MAARILHDKGKTVGMPTSKPGLQCGLSCNAVPNHQPGYLAVQRHPALWDPRPCGQTPHLLLLLGRDEGAQPAQHGTPLLPAALVSTLLQLQSVGCTEGHFRTLGHSLLPPTLLLRTHALAAPKSCALLGDVCPAVWLVESVPGKQGSNCIVSLFWG